MNVVQVGTLGPTNTHRPILKINKWHVMGTNRKEEKKSGRE